MKTRRDQYWEFRAMIHLLEQYAALLRIPLRDGECHRPADQCERMAKAGKGIVDSKHRYSLAKDEWIISGRTGKDIEWAVTAEIQAKYLLLGTFWEFIGGIWGGHFKKRYDPYHFESKEKPL